MKFLIFASVMATLSFYVFSRLVSHSPRPDLSVGWVILATVITVALQLTAFKTMFLTPAAYETVPWKATVVMAGSWAVYTLIGAFYSMILYTVLTDIASIAYGYLSPSTPAAVINKWTFIAVLGLTAASTAVGVLQAFAPPVIVRADVPIKNLPADLDGFTIAQISDLHVGPLIHKPFVERVAEATNKLSPDIVALTGDFADGRVAVLKKDLAPLKDIKAPQYFIMGNHEYYWYPQEWIALYREMGMKVLLNSHENIRRGAATLTVAGVEDYSQGPVVSDPAKALEGAPRDAIKVLLAHQPSDYVRANAAGAHLQLSGHTHGGQFFPWSMVVRFFHRYFTGLHQHEDMYVYINRGTGFWGTPLRTFVPPEITLLTLKQAE